MQDGESKNEAMSFIHNTSIVDPGAEIGAGTKIWQFCHIYGSARIGTNCVLGQNVMIGPGVTVGNNCKIQNNVSLYEGVALDDDVFCGPSCVFTNVKTPRAHIERKTEFLGIHVGRGATIGANATIICGVRIGAYAFIGAGAVVTKSVPDYALMIGSPASRAGWVGQAGERLSKDLECPRNGQRFVEKDGVLTLLPR